MATIISFRGPVVGGHRMCSMTKGASCLPKLKLGNEYGLAASELCGVKIPTTNLNFPAAAAAPLLSVSFKPALQVVASRVCRFTGKKSNRANKVSHSNHKTKKLQFVNLQYKKIWWEAGKRYLKLRLSTKAIKTIEKNGLDAVAKKVGIDLSKE